MPGGRARPDHAAAASANRSRMPRHPPERVDAVAHFLHAIAVHLEAAMLELDPRPVRALRHERDLELGVHVGVVGPVGG